MATVTEAQKKQIMILLTAFLTILIYISGIIPLQESIAENETRLESVRQERESMQAIVENGKIETDYETLRSEYQVKFQERFENFKSNEKIEAITKEWNQPILSINIRDFEPVSTMIYEKYIAQPKTEEELTAVRADENSSIFPMLLCSQVELSVEVTPQEMLNLYDAFNNIVPAGPGDGDPDRYCILIPDMNLNGMDSGSSRVSYQILVFAMETMDMTTWDEEYAARKQGS